MIRTAVVLALAFTTAVLLLWPGQPDRAKPRSDRTTATGHPDGQTEGVSTDKTPPRTDPSGATLLVRVVDQRSGDAIAGAQCALEPTDGGMRLASRTGDNGATRFDGCPVGVTVTVSVAAAGYAAESRSVHVSEAIVSLEFALTGPVRIEGTVHDDAGIPIVEAAVTVARGPSVYSAVTDGFGRFTILGVPSDEHASLRVQKVGYRSVQFDIRLEGVVPRDVVLTRIAGVILSLELTPGDVLGDNLSFDVTIGVRDSVVVSQSLVFRSGRATTWFPYAADADPGTVTAKLAAFGAPVAEGSGAVSATPDGRFAVIVLSVSRSLGRCRLMAGQQPLRDCLVHYALEGGALAPRTAVTNASGVAVVAIRLDRRDSDHYCFWSAAGVSSPIPASTLRWTSDPSDAQIVELGNFGGAVVVAGPKGLLPHVGLRNCAHGFSEYPRNTDVADSAEVSFQAPPGEYLVTLRRQPLSSTPIAVTRGDTVHLDLADHLAAGTIRGVSLPNSSVELWVQGDHATELINTMHTDEVGLFAFTSLLSGRYVVSMVDADGILAQRRAVINGSTIVDLGSLVDAIRVVTVRLRYDTGAPFVNERIRWCGLPRRENVSTVAVTDASGHIRVAAVDSDSIFIGTTYGYGLLRDAGTVRDAEVIVPTVQGGCRLYAPADIAPRLPRLQWLTTRGNVLWVVAVPPAADGTPRFAGSRGTHQFLASTSAGLMSLRGVVSGEASDVHLRVSPTVKLDSVLGRARVHTFDAIVARLGDFDIEALGLMIRRGAPVAGHGPLAIPSPGAVRIVGRAADGTVVEEGLLAADE